MRETETERFVWKLQHPDPIGMELASEAYIEAAGPDCLIPGQEKPIRVLGLKVQINHFWLFSLFELLYCFFM